MSKELTAAEALQLEKHSRAIRSSVVAMITEAQSGHPGGSLSAVDILTTLYFAEMNGDLKQFARDRLVLSKGHAAPALYATLAERGIFPKEELLTLRKMNSRLQGHPSMKCLPGIDMSTGSLGQGLSIAAGMALAARLDGSNHRIYTILGDGELEEGMVWEGAMFAAHYKLDNLTAFVDYNGLQIDGPVCKVMSPLPLADKWQAFNWHVIEIDGHDINAIYGALQEAKKIKGQPTVIVAATIKGKGVTQMENVAEWHGKAPSREQCDLFLAQLNDVKAGV